MDKIIETCSECGASLQTCKRCEIDNVCSDVDCLEGCPTCSSNQDFFESVSAAIDDTDADGMDIIDAFY